MPLILKAEDVQDARFAPRSARSAASRYINKT